MTVRHMKIFLQVYQTLNMTRAAELLHMTQPAVTRTIQEIEQYYGVRLFERINRRLYVTESGKELYAHALHIVDTFDAMEKGMRNWDEFGVLRVGASITLGNFLLPDLTVAFQIEHPNLQVRALISNGRQLQEALMDNRLDLALIEGGVSEPNLRSEVFSRDRLILILPPDHPLCRTETLNLQDITSYPMLLREQGSVGRSFLDHVFAVHGLSLEPVWESASTQALVKAVSAGLGISFLPEQLVRADLEAGTVSTRPIADESFLRQHWIVWHRNKFLTASARKFIAMTHRISEECRDSIASRT